MRLPFPAASGLLLAGAGIASAAHYDVTVGKNGQLKFVPEEIIAHDGDTITYHFFSRNHAVAESTFEDPCQYREDGIFSGFVPTTSETIASATSFTITITDHTKPIWLYCPQTNGNHCQNGMVHAINAHQQGADTMATYKRAAQHAEASTVRDDNRPFGGLRAVDIKVGMGTELVFEPNNITEPVGTHLMFNFNPANHSVVESSFAYPCKQLHGGFSSGFVPTQKSPSGAVFDVLVEDENPMWFFCAQGRHCQSGMVGAVNAPAYGEHTLEAYIDLAADVPDASSIAPQAPLAGILTIDGVPIDTMDTNVIVPGESWHQSPTEPSTTKYFITTPPSPSASSGDHEEHWPEEEGNGAGDHWPEDGDQEEEEEGNGAGDHWPEDVGQEEEEGNGAGDHWPEDAAPTSTHASTHASAPIPTPPAGAGAGDYIGWVPKPGEQDQYMMDQAGGAPISNYSWPESISEEVTDLLTLIKFVEDILITALITAHDSLTTGSWAGIYPASIVQTIGAMKAQAWIQRSLSTDTLQHFDKPIPQPCSYKIPMSTADEWLDSVTTLLNLHIGLTSSALAQIADTDAWLVPCLATSMGATARTTGVIAMMRGRSASAAPREVPIPAPLVYSYAMANYVDSCPEHGLPWSGTSAVLKIDQAATVTENGRVTEIKVQMTQELKDAAEDDGLFFAWMGPWGELYFTPVFGDGEAEVPAGLYGYVWVVATTNSEASLYNLHGDAIAGPVQVWVG